MPLSIAIALVGAACNPPNNVGGPCADIEAGAGEAPCRQQFYFPTGLATDPAGDVLYVANGNADLRYSGGTVMAIDLVKFECGIAWARGGYHWQGTPPAGCEGYDFSSLSQYNGATNYSNQCRANPLDPSVLECDESPFIADAVTVGNFAGEIQLQLRPTGSYTFPVVDNACPAGSMPATPTSCGTMGAPPSDGRVVACSPVPDGKGPEVSRRLWLAVRGDPSITWIDVRHAGGVTSLECRDPHPPGGSVPASCTGQRITLRDFHSDQPGVDTSTQQPLPPEPFGLALDECTDCSCAAQYSHLGVTHLAGGEITIINSGAFRPTSESGEPNPPERVILDVRGNFFGLDATGHAGAYGIGVRTPGDPSSYWYATSRISPAVASFQVALDGTILPVAGFNVGGASAFGAGDDVRDFVFDPTGDRAFFLDNHPPSLFTLDTRIDPMDVTGGPRNTVVDEVSVCQGDSHLGRVTWTEPGAPGSPDRIVTRVFVVCFTAGQVMIVDPDLGEIVDTINAGQGSNAISFNFGPGVSAACDAATPCPGAAESCVAGACMPSHRRAYISNYLDHTISVVDLDRGSPFEDRVFARIGLSPIEMVPQ